MSPHHANAITCNSICQNSVSVHFGSTDSRATINQIHLFNFLSEGIFLLEGELAYGVRRKWWLEFSAPAEGERGIWVKSERTLSWSCCEVCSSLLFGEDSQWGPVCRSSMSPARLLGLKEWMGGMTACLSGLLSVRVAECIYVEKNVQSSVKLMWKGKKN